MNKTLLLLLGVLLITSCKQKTNSVKEIVDNQQIKDSLTAEINTLNKNYFNGLGVAIVDTSGVVYEKGLGFSDINSNKLYDKNTIQPIASVSKTFIGIALLKAQEKGLLNLDDPINKYLPFTVTNPKFKNEPITIRQLSTHTSTIIDTDNYMGRAYVLKDKIDSTSVNIENIPQSFNPNETKIPLSQFLENYLSENGKWFEKNAFTENEPGELFAYTNIGATLAAYIIEIVSNQSYAEFTSQYILKPLKMNNSGWSYEAINFNNVSKLYSNPKTEVPYYSLITYPDGGFLTSVNDLSKYLNEIMKGYYGNGTLLTKASYQELFKEQLRAENFTERNANHPYKDDYNIGIFMGFSGTGNIGHTGGDPGASSLMFFNPKDKIGRILLVNTNIENQEGVNAYFGIFNKLEAYSKKLDK
jgi:CubicO group peptidase (beta-lactamase class C family)